MKISKAIEELKAALKKHGDINLAYWNDYEDDNGYSVSFLETLGAFKIPDPETNRSRSAVVLVRNGLKGFAAKEFGNDPAPLKK